MPLAPLGKVQQYCSVFNFQLVFRGLFLQLSSLCLRMRTDSLRQYAMRIIKEEKNLQHFANLVRQCQLILLYGAETEIRKIKDDGKIERETNLDRHSPSQIGTV
jgi:hypothetical protein